MTGFYRCNNFNFNDFDLVVKNNTLYAVYVKKNPYSKKGADSKKPNRWGLAKSNDGVAWEEVRDIICPVKNSWEESLWAGSISKQGKRYVIYYTAVSSKDRESSCQVGKAHSSNLIKWKKDPSNPILTFNKNDPHYSAEPKLAFRDPFWFRHKGKKYLLMCAKDKTKPKDKKGCVGLFEEDKKNKFKSLLPIFSPGKYYALECPALYHLKGMWYLLYGDDKGQVFRYAIAQKPFGPYKEPKNNLLHPKFQYVSRIIKFKGKHLMYWWTRDFLKGVIRERLTGPKEIKTTKGGEIRLTDL